MYIDSINSQGTDYAISSFQETLINAQDNDEVKTIDFPSGYNLDSNLSFNIMFVKGHICSANNKPMTLNGKAIKVYSYSDPTLLVDLPMNTFDSKIWTLRPNTSLELYYNGTQFIVVGNPIVYTTSDCDYYANGKVEYKKSIVTTQNKVNDSCNVLLQGSQIGSSGYYNVNTACGNTLTFNSSTGVLSANTFSGALNGKANTAGTADNATKFNGCTYDCAKADIRDGLVSMANIGTGTYQLALCTGTNTISTTPSLTFNACEGVLSATKFRGSFCGTADNATKFNNCTYECAKADIRNGLTDCLGTVTWCDKGDAIYYPITFCTGDKVVGVTSNTNMDFKYNPQTGTLKVRGFTDGLNSTLICDLFSRCDCNLTPNESPTIIYKVISNLLGIVRYCWNCSSCGGLFEDYLRCEGINGKFALYPTLGKIIPDPKNLMNTYRAEYIGTDEEAEIFIQGRESYNESVCRFFINSYTCVPKVEIIVPIITQ